MDWTKARSVETKITRLTHEIEEIDRFFYRGYEKEDRSLFAGMLERKRDDMVRSAVLQLHTAIEEILNSLVIRRILNAKPYDKSSKMRTARAQALRKMLVGAGSLGFDMKLNFAVALGLVDAKTKDKLMDLNTLRNKCSHNWLLKESVRRGRRPRQKKPPLLLYQGRDLHKVTVLKDFAGEFGPIYAKLHAKYSS